MVMKAAEDWRCYDATPVLDGTMDRGILLERLMGSQLIIVSSILLQDLAQIDLAQDDHMVDALAPDRPNQAFSKANTGEVFGTHRGEIQSRACPRYLREGHRDKCLPQPV